MYICLKHKIDNPIVLNGNFSMILLLGQKSHHTIILNQNLRFFHYLFICLFIIFMYKSRLYSVSHFN